MTELQRALALVDLFENGPPRPPKEMTNIVAAIVRACGHPVTELGFIDKTNGIDCYFQGDLDGKSQTIAVDIWLADEKVHDDVVNLAFHMSQEFDRAMIISRSGFSKNAVRLANDIGVGKIDLFAPSDLRAWITQYSHRDGADQSCMSIVRAAMRDLAFRLSEYPHELATVGWLDLERILRETFEGIGFKTVLTRSGKDGGFDLELTTVKLPTETFLVEVKHWATQKPGLAHLNKLVRVTASRCAAGGLLLSTSGFTKTVYSGLADFDAPIRLGAGEKIISLCRAYYRVGNGLWLESSDLRDVLFSGTTRPGSENVGNQS